MEDGILQDYLKDKFGHEVRQIDSVSGGSINRAARAELKNDDVYFVKWNTAERAEMFESECRGLEILRRADSALVFPDVIAHETLPDEDISLLILEYLEPARPENSFFERFGRDLAGLHRNNGARYGLDHDNYIGRLPQDNTLCDKWIEFFIERRLRPQFELAVRENQLPATLRQNFERLYDRLPEILPTEKPSLLHGDLWSGNFLSVGEGKAALVDPAVYYGNRETEIAFTRLFGGFDAAFYDAYGEAWPLPPGFEKRVDIYNLYPLLVHVNMFGRAYADQVQAIILEY